MCGAPNPQRSASRRDLVGGEGAVLGVSGAQFVRVRTDLPRLAKIFLESRLYHALLCGGALLDMSASAGIELEKASLRVSSITT